jgi:lysozyme family protein
MKSKYDFKTCEKGITDLISSAHVIDVNAAKSIALNAITFKARYMWVAERMGIPWDLICAIHFKESSMRFTRNLCNGEPLNQVTKLVPKGRGPYPDWETSALDAIQLQKRITDTIDISNGWSFAEKLWWAECYNGLGYRQHGINTPYLWANTNQYSKGGYPRDGYYDRDYVIKNSGIFSIIWAINDIQGHLDHLPKDFDVRMTAEEKPELFT